MDTKDLLALLTAIIYSGEQAAAATINAIQVNIPGQQPSKRDVASVEKSMKVADNIIRNCVNWKI